MSDVILDRVSDSGSVDIRNQFILRIASKAYLEPCTRRIREKTLARVPVVSPARRQSVVRLLCKVGYGNEVISSLISLYRERGDTSVVQNLLELSKWTESPTVVKRACRHACFEFMQNADFRVCEDSVKVLRNSTACASPAILSQLLSILDWHQAAVEVGHVRIKHRELFISSLEDSLKELGATVPLVDVFPSLGESPPMISEDQIRPMALVARKGDEVALKALLSHVFVDAQRANDSPTSRALSALVNLAPDNVVAVVDHDGFFHLLRQRIDNSTMRGARTPFPLKGYAGDSVPHSIVRGDEDTILRLQSMLDAGTCNATMTVSLIHAMAALVCPSQDKWVRCVAPYLKYDAGEVRRAASFCIRYFDETKWKEFNLGKFMDPNYSGGSATGKIVAELLAALEKPQHKRPSPGQSTEKLQTKRENINASTTSDWLVSALKESIDGCSHRKHGFTSYPATGTNQRCFNCNELLAQAVKGVRGKAYMCDNCDLVFCGRCRFDGYPKRQR